MTLLSAKGQTRRKAGTQREGSSTKKLARKAALVAATGLLVGAIAPAAMAADPTDVNLIPGSLSITNPAVANFSDVTLDGTAKTTTAAMENFSVTDARGSGAGWNVTVQATRFTEVDALTGTYVLVDPKRLPAGSLSMPAPTVAADGTTSPGPSITSGPYTIDSGSAVKIASAAVGNGMGKYDFTQGGNLSLSIPATASAARYRSDVTVSAVTGP